MRRAAFILTALLLAAPAAAQDTETPTPVDTDTPTPVDTPTNTATPVDTDTPTPADTPTATGTATQTGTVTQTPTPVLTAAPRGTWTARTAFALGENEPVVMQYDESYAFACEFGQALSAVTGMATYLRGEAEGVACTGLLTNLQVESGDTSRAIWRLTPGSLDDEREHICWVHLVATASDGAVLACDGRVTVRRRRPAT